MPHADHQIFAPVGHSEDIDVLLSIAGQFSCLKDRVAVLMDPVPETFRDSVILVPKGEHTGKFRPDSGTVVSSGHPDLERGDRVMVKPYDGLWLTSKDCAVDFPEDRKSHYRTTQDRMAVVRAYHRNVSPGGILLSDNVHDEKPQMGLVCSSGPDCVSIMEGDRILYSKYGGSDIEGFLVLNEDQVYCVIRNSLYIPEGRELRFYNDMGAIVAKVEGL